MLRRPLAFALTLIAATVSWSPVGARPSRQAEAAWLRTESRRFEIHYQRALAADLDRVVRSAETAYNQIAGRLNFVLATKVPLVVFAPAGRMTQDEVVAYAISDSVAPQQPHRSRIVLPLPDTSPQLDTRLVHELTHLLMSEIILPGRGGDGGLPRWVHEGIASHMVGAWSDDDTRLMRELVASGGIPALSQLTGSGGIRQRAPERRRRACRLRLHREPLGAHRHSTLSERAHRPARG